MPSFINKLLYGGGIIFDLCKWIILALVILLIMFRFWYSVFIVDGESMEPNLHDKEIVILKNDSYESGDPKRGDVVAVRYPGDPDNKKYVKRVIGLPGDSVRLTDGKVYVNDKILEESYLSYNVKTTPNRENNWRLNPGEFFLMGDNRPFSNDSRYFGPVEKRFFNGKAIMIIFPRIHII